MEWLFIFALMFVCASLWSRLHRAEQRLEASEGLLDMVLQRLRDPGHSEASAPEPPAAPRTDEDTNPLEEPAVEIAPEPAVTLARSVHDPSKVDVSTEPEEPLTELAEDHRPEEEQAPLAERFRLALDFEDIFGRRLPIWAGGVALAVAGVFLVRYSIEQGLLTPQVRVIMAFLFGLALLAGAEVAYRFEERVADERVRQALAGAGLATLYAGFYLAGTQYGLIGQTFAFLGLAGVTAAAIALSYRFGLPSAVLGLVGGFAAPMLVGSDEPNLPLLSLYLGLVTAGLVLTGRRQERPWLGITAMVGGLGWGALMLLTGEFGTTDILALGLYFVVLGVVLPALTGSKRFAVPLRLASAGAAAIQSAVLVGQAGFLPLAWGLYLLLGAALGWLGWKRADLRPAMAFAAALGLLMLADWHPDSKPFYAVIASAIAILFAGLPLVHLKRAAATIVDRLMVILVPPVLAFINFANFGSFNPDRVEPVLAASALTLAVLPATAAYLERHSAKRWIFALYAASAALLVFSAILLLTPSWLAPVAAAATSLGIGLLLHRRPEPALANVLWGGGVIGLCALAASTGFGPETGMWGSIEDLDRLRALLRWGAAATPFAALAWLDPRAPLRHGAEALAALLLYGALSQVVPPQWLAWTAAVLALAAHASLRPRLAAQVVWAGIAFIWALEPLLNMLGTGAGALLGNPAFVQDLPSPRSAALRILPAAVALAMLRSPDPADPSRSLPGWPLAIPLLGVVLYVLFKQVFAIGDEAQFVAEGMAERTLWQALLLMAAVFAAREWPRIGTHRSVSIALACAAVLHFTVFTFILHNPLWDRQAVGPVPIANLALAAYTVAIGSVLFVRRHLPATLRPWIDAVVMALAAAGCLTLLRQVFGGSVMVEEPMSQTEDLLRSMLGIVLALSFLLLGMMRTERSWRVGSLVLMLIAVAKVFILDAAELEGLARIASFALLGAALIGIGWLYSRLLRRGEPLAER